MLARPRLPRPVHAVGFDLDGTLIDTIGDLAFAGNLMREELGLPPISPELIKSFVGKGIPNLVRRTLTVDRVDALQEDELRRGLELYERHYMAVLTRTSAPFPGVAEGLRLIAGMNVRLACVTNKSTRFTLPLLEHTRLGSHFEVVVCGDSLLKKKPDPLPLRHVCEQFAIAAQEFLYVGDSVNDTEAARAARCPVVVVSYGYHQRDDPAELEADAVVSTLVEVADLIENSGSRDESDRSDTQ